MCEDSKVRKAMGELESRMSVQEAKIEMIEKYMGSMSKDIKWIRDCMFDLSGSNQNSKGKLDMVIKYSIQGGTIGGVISVMLWVLDKI